ncbi:hypothetical protein BJ138DRAFT_1195509 [Hygrophoropsis aurantiaca]|uniref:Uncharacterized protein n=1 Tax=Hygrophoropsis aurantiaca TaxID=72124 RepID=A0ACB7ZQR6_9AGAM|nr:hypothetical protein BJ138DRAFT_1195509 [Hygrophoropsis aurantiaca]
MKLLGPVRSTATTPLECVRNTCRSSVRGVSGGTATDPLHGLLIRSASPRADTQRILAHTPSDTYTIQRLRPPTQTPPNAYALQHVHHPPRTYANTHIRQHAHTPKATAPNQRLQLGVKVLRLASKPPPGVQASTWRQCAHLVSKPPPGVQASAWRQSPPPGVQAFHLASKPPPGVKGAAFSISANVNAPTRRHIDASPSHQRINASPLHQRLASTTNAPPYINASPPPPPAPLTHAPQASVNWAGSGVGRPTRTRETASMARGVAWLVEYRYSNVRRACYSYWAGRGCRYSYWVPLQSLGTAAATGHWVPLQSLGTAAVTGYRCSHWVPLQPLGTTAATGYRCSQVAAATGHRCSHWAPLQPLGTAAATGHHCSSVRRASGRYATDPPHSPPIRSVYRGRHAAYTEGDTQRISRATRSVYRGRHAACIPAHHPTPSHTPSNTNTLNTYANTPTRTHAK